MFLVSIFFGNKGLDPKKIPQTKKELEKVLKTPNQTSFTTDIFGYRTFNISEWLESKEMYDFEYNISTSYEPYYVVRRNSQLYDETFVTWGYNKVTQIFDMNVVGYKMKILPDSYMIHLNHSDLKGFKYWFKGFKQDARNQMKVGTSINRWQNLPGLLTNTYFPPWLNRNATKITICEDYYSKDKLDMLENDIITIKQSIHTSKVIVISLMGVFVLLLVFVIFH